MENKYFLKNNKKEVHIGDTIVFGGKIKGVTFEIEGTLTEELLDTLIRQGVIENNNPKSIQDYLKDIMHNMNEQGVGNPKDAIASWWDYNPASLLSTLLRNIAIDLDKKYEDHISKSPEIYVISLLNGKITKANKAHIKNYRNFAAFRTIEDAKEACKIVKPLLKELFNE